MNAADKIYIILLNWNGCKDTRECLRSLEKAGPEGREILIVDNGSTDDSVKVLKKEFPKIKILETGKNLGYTGGMNAGIKYALAEDAGYIILLNNDTVVDPLFAEELVKAAKKEKKAGLLCSKIYFYANPNVISYAGAGFNELLGWGRQRGYNETESNQYNRLEETKRPSGCSLLVTPKFIESVGLLDEDLFCYSEDTDWGLRARAAGFKVLFVPASKVWHKEAVSTGGAASALSLYYNVRNTLYCLDKNRPLNPGLNFLRILSVACTSFLSLFTMKIPKRRGAARILRGMSDYLRGKMGPLENKN